MKIDVLTLFPEMFRPVMESSMLGRAVAAGILQIKATDIRQFSHDKHNKADDYPFGGGGGMVMMADPVFGAMESVEAEKKVIYIAAAGRSSTARRSKNFRRSRRWSFYAAITKEWIRGRWITGMQRRSPLVTTY